ncbi:hypothetical protein [Stackebrandtia nassauensis]|uniref:Uncharacterized protein n=1 Tax=Stackebrandtia nassauensis (strain DSM 44728 / CIP 108903 / NRRL B-16338 / NBRC 102104 / LLR-40K-21) TaxID=446470 RepID=D3PWN1_STANL|nr:hypothetical protein [Stackebrandtia nassauensis]ADD43253.1 hypothetical protein Snas_3593 [Stackebrandtia nassauensis DSM 44728]
MERMATALACAAIDRHLAGVLLFNLDPGRIGALGRWLAALLGSQTRTVLAGAATHDEDLWTRFSLSGSQVSITPGALFDQTVVLVPDLTQLSDAGARAAIATIGADVAHIERDGHQSIQVPKARWLVGCRREGAGELSRHLLDRFALRVDAADVPGELDPPPRSWRDAVERAAHATPLPMSTRVLGYVMELFTAADAGARRPVAVARLARAIARLDGDETVSVRHVDLATEHLGIPRHHRLSVVDDASPLSRNDAAGPAPNRTEEAIQAPEGPVPQYLAAGAGFEAPSAVHTSLVAVPYPEDEPMTRSRLGSVNLDHTSPQWSNVAAHGRPWGTVPAHDLTDLSITASLLEACKLQVMRCPGHHGSAHRLHVTAADLRRHKRTIQPTDLLVLLVDHTCGGANWNLPAALGAHIAWAYEQRAHIRVVELGDADSADELSARQFVVRNALDRRLHRVLSRRPGRATPLAHGIELAGRVLRRFAGSDRSVARDTRFVLVTDGRGNVPLSASLTGQVDFPVARRGVEDSLYAARQIRTLPRTQTIVVCPGSHRTSPVVTELAQVLGADILTGDGDNG